MELSEKKRVIIVTAILLIIAVISFFWIAGIASAEENFDGTYKSLDAKRVTVTELMGATMASSVAVSMLPSDVGNSIADRLADLSGYFMFILAAIIFEKWLCTLTGFLAFKILIPIACLILIAVQFFESEKLKAMGVNLLLVGILIFAIIPASTMITEKIDSSYQASVQQTIDDSNKTAKTVKKSNAKDSSWLEKAKDSLTAGVKNKIEQFENLLNRTIEHLAVLIVTSCVIPIAVILFFFWLIKLITGVSISLPRFKGSKMFKRNRE